MRTSASAVFITERDRSQTFELGVWVFLISEAMLFSALLIGVVVYRVTYPAAFMEGSRHLKIAFGSVNTFLLLTSSLLVAIAVEAARKIDVRLTRVCLYSAITLGILFLGVKGTEYYQEFSEQLVPGINFSFSGLHAGQVRLFFILYFFVTLLHALHLIIGLCFLTLSAHFSKNRSWLATQQKIISSTALYWHFVDIVWVFVFPILYLNGRSG